jgi:thiol-disulfide isomerase/thioredoxin
MRYNLLLITVLLLASCGSRAKKEAEVTAAPLKIEIPAFPAMGGTNPDPAQVAQFLADHYWDKMNFADTAYIEDSVTLQAFSNYAYILNNIPPEMAARSVDATMNKAKADGAMYAYFAKMARDHFYDETPFRNEDIYIAVLNNIIAWDGTDELNKLRPRAELDLAMKNRVGDAAIDFEFTTSDDRKMRLYDVKARFTMLYFNLPECPHCAEFMAQFAELPITQRLVQSGELKVVAVYTEGDLTKWRANLGEMPANWTKAYAPESTADIYYMRAKPSFYLLDKDKRVLVKDGASAQQLEYYFYNTL